MVRQAFIIARTGVPMYEPGLRAVSRSFPSIPRGVVNDKTGSTKYFPDFNLHPAKACSIFSLDCSIFKNFFAGSYIPPSPKIVFVKNLIVSFFEVWKSLCIRLLISLIGYSMLFASDCILSIPYCGIIEAHKI